MQPGPRPPLDPAEVMDVVTGYMPSTRRLRIVWVADPDLRDFVIEAAMSMPHRTRADASGYLAILVRFAAWCAEQSLVMRPESLFQFDVFEAYLSQLPLRDGHYDRTRATLLNTARQAGIEAMPRLTRKTEPKRGAIPYTSEEIARYHRLVREQHTQLAWRTGIAIMAGAHGAGLVGEEITYAQAKDLEQDEHGFLWHVGGKYPRTVPVLARYSEDLAQVLASIGSEEYLSGRGPGTINLGTQVRQVKTGSLAGFSTPRLRATWLAGLLGQPIPPALLFHVASRAGAGPMPRLARLAPAPELAPFRHLFRGDA